MCAASSLALACILRARARERVPQKRAASRESHVDPLQDRQHVDQRGREPAVC